MPIYIQKHQILDRLKKEPLADISDMLDNYVLGQLEMEDQDKTEQEIRDDFWETWRKGADCTRRQAKLALLDYGLLDAVEAWADDPNTPIEARITWKESYRFVRDSAMIDEFMGNFQLTAEQVDDIVRLAQSKEA